MSYPPQGIALDIGLADGQIAQLPISTLGQVLQRGPAKWGAREITGPVAPPDLATGDLFFHTPPGRQILYLYNADTSTWIPLQSHGDMTLFVDPSGTDDIEHGTGPGANAFQTIQYAIDIIPGAVGGNVYIYLSGDSYAENISIGGKDTTGSFGIILMGALSTVLAESSLDSGIQGGATTQSSITKTGAGWAANAYQHRLCHFTSGANTDLYRIIDSNAVTTLTLVGAPLNAAPAPGDTFEVLDWATTVQGVSVEARQTDVDIRDIHFTTSTSNMRHASSLVVRRCRFDPVFQLISHVNGSAQFSLFLAQSNAGCANVYGKSNITFSSCKFVSVNTSEYCCIKNEDSRIGVGTCVLDTGNRGIFMFGNAVCSCWSSTLNNFFRNMHLYGIRAETGAQCFNAQFNSYSACGTNASAVSSQYAFIKAF